MAEYLLLHVCNIEKGPGAHLTLFLNKQSLILLFGMVQHLSSVTELCLVNILIPTITFATHSYLFRRTHFGCLYIMFVNPDISMNMNPQWMLF